MEKECKVYSKEEIKQIGKKDIERCDVLILGTGMAGLTAAIYTTRYNLKTTLIGKNIGGTGNIAGHVENWPGFVGSGLDLMQKIVQQVKDSGANFVEGEITKVEKDEEGFFVELEDKIIHGKSLIITLGMQHRKLNVKGEEEFLGKGVSYCATCDGPLFKNKTVAVIGGADSAAKAAIYLSEICKKVYIIYRKGELRCEPVSLDQIKKKNNIEVHYFSKPGEIIGEKLVKAIHIKQDCDNSCKDFTLPVDGIFIEIGATPMLEVVKPLGLKMAPGEFIITDKDAKTNVPGVFAAGDNTDTKFKQFVVSAGEGSIAAKGVYDYLRFFRK